MHSQASVWWKSLSWRLILLALTPLLPVFGLSVYHAVNAREQAFTEARTTVKRLAGYAESELATRILSTRQVLHVMAADPVLRGSDFAACSATLEASMKLDDRRRSFVVAGRDGNLLCSSEPSVRSANYADREYFRRALETRQPVISKPLIGRVAKVAVTIVGQPLLDANGEVQRLLLASVDLASLGTLIADSSDAEGAVFALSNEEGQVMYRWPDNDKWTGHRDSNASINQEFRRRHQDEAFEAVGIDGVSRIYAAAQSRDYPPGSLVIRVGINRDTLTAAADRDFAASVVGLTAIAALMLLAARFASNRLVLRPVALLAHGVGRFRDGELAERIPVAAMSGELAGLAAGFNRMAAALEAQVARAESLIESAPDPIVIADREGRIVVVNAQAEAVFGYTRAELLGQPVEMLIPQRLHATHAAQRAPYQEKPHVRAMGAGRELLARRKDGTEFSVDVSLSPLVTPEGVLVISTVRDVTERMQAQRALQHSERLVRATMDALQANLCVLDEEGTIAAVNQGWRAFAAGNGADPAKVSEGTNYLAVCAATTGPDRPAAEAIAEGIRAVALGTMERFDLEYPCHSPEQRRWFRASASRFRVGQALRVVLSHFDISERVEAEQRIRGQLERLKLLEQITRSTGERQDLKSIFGVVVRSLEDSLPLDFACVCLYAATASALTVSSVGVKSEALARELAMDAGASIDVDANGLSRCVQGQLVYEPDIGQVDFPFPQRLARGGLRSLVTAPLKSESRVFGCLVVARRKANAFSSGECEFLRQLSEHVALAAHQAQLYESLQQAYDDLRQAQAATMQEERLRALGQMASGVAHDINNALSPVSLYTESLLETEQGLSDRARGYLDIIRRAVADVAETLARMRDFYRQREEQIELAPVDANQMVQQVLDLTKAHWRDMALKRSVTIQAVTELAPDLPRIMGVESEIRDALTNFVFNAVDAMPEGGTLTLRTRTAGFAPEQQVIMEVVDSGIGMDEETRNRCLEPFFTTKGERGTGLGLAMVFGMAQRHSCEIEIDSAPGAGTTMRLVFVVPTAVIVEPGQAVAAPAALRRLRLLLVDDDPVLLNSLRDALELDSHIVVTTNGGQAGIAEFRASLDRGEPYAAVITDLGMPYVDGRRVAAAVKDASPATPVILLTGWGQRLKAEGDIPPHVDRLLAKPPKLRELRVALAQLCRRTEA